MLLFAVFFSIGAAALSISSLCDDLLRYYHNKQLLKSAKESLKRLDSLNADYDALLRQLQEDPNLIKRIAHAALGTERKDEDTVYPKVTPEQLDAARKALTKGPNRQFHEPMTPLWLTRCREPRRRMMLFFSGAGLILISFIWFGSGKRAGQ
jgi:hypothetical protein